MAMPPTHVFVTRYALTKGIVKAKVERFHESSVSVAWPGGYNGEAFFGEAHYLRTLEEAQTRAEAMRVKKIASLQKQIKKLEKLKIKVMED